MSVIAINGNHLDPEAHAPTLRAFGLVSEDASKSDYILVQTQEPLSNEQEDELVGLGIVIHEYVSQSTYLCGYKGTDLEVLRSLPYVVWVNVYLDLFVIQPSLKAPTHATDTLSAFATVPKSRVLHLVDISLHRDVDSTSRDIQTAIAAAARASPVSLTVCGTKIRLHVEEQYMDDVAAVDGVRLIQEVHPAKLFNNKAVSILKADVPVNGIGYKGEGQVVAVADTGFDKGNPNDCHSAFAGRVKKLYALGRTEENLADDPDGHGTHVCGSVLGDGNSGTMGGQIQGTAPKATLVLQSLLDSENSLGGIPADFGKLFLPPYEDEGARLHTNSWGSSSRNQLPYDASSTGIDRFVWDHPDLVILFAAGNDGMDVNRDGVIDPKQIGAEAAAKNCITVGASENDRPDIPVAYGSRWPAMPIRKDKMADRPDGMAAFSSRGPTKEGRIKPDIVAPGTAILSTRSGHLAMAMNSFGTSTDPEWMFLAGTSMATPLVAGCAAVMRESLVKNGTPNPSAALIKALLINGAVELPGQYVPSEAGPSPNSSSGFGRVNVANSIILPTQTDAGWSEGGPLLQDQGKDSPIKVTIPGKTEAVALPGGGSVPSTTTNGATLKVTLVWSDPPGEHLQNDLDLIVIAADGAERHGNMGTKSDFDRSNNVEQVVWTNMPPGEAKIIVYAYHIFSKKFPQPYAVVWSINRPLK